MWIGTLDIFWLQSNYDVVSPSDSLRRRINGDSKEDCLKPEVNLDYAKMWSVVTF